MIFRPPFAVRLVLGAMAACAACTDPAPPIRSDLVCAYTRWTGDNFRCAPDEVPRFQGDEAFDELPVDAARDKMASGQFACWHVPERGACECAARCDRSELDGAILCECSAGNYTDDAIAVEDAIVDTCVPELGGVCCDYGFGCACRSDQSDCSWTWDFAEPVEACAPQPLGEPGTRFEEICVDEDGPYPCESEGPGWIWVSSCDAVPWPDDDDDTDTDTDDPNPSGDPTGNDTDPPTPGDLPDGARCQEDADCTQGSRCLASLAVTDSARTCGPPCASETSTDDCRALVELDIALQVPNIGGDGEPPNAWNSTVLGRGTACGPEGFCQYGCPPGAAVAFDESGAPQSCICLPNHRYVNGECVWEDAVECSVLAQPGAPNPCDACNSDQLFPDCSTGRFQCLIDSDALEGQCVEWASIGELEACIEGGVGYDCDPDCYANCSNANCTPTYCNVDGCVDLCCTPTSEPPEPGSCS